MLLLGIIWEYFKSCYPLLRQENFTIAAVMVWCLCCSPAALAKSESKPAKLDQFPPNPLEMTTPDPLLPRPLSKQKQPLSLLEVLNLATALNELNIQATAQLQAGDRSGAFATWNRELRLRRALGLLEEVKALGRVGAIAWSENQRQELQIITGRLQTIQQQTQPQSAVVNLELLQALGQAYQQVRSPQPALEVYQQILLAERWRRDPAAQEVTLKTIAELALVWFDYPKAAATYQQLLGLARIKGDHISELTDLQQLAYIYDQAKQPQQAVVIKQQLARIYLKERNLSQLPVLKLAIASDYESLNQQGQAFRSYQEAYTTAWSLQEYYRASEALQHLVKLYRGQAQLDEALRTSQILLQADEQTSNYYGMMTTYDQIGQIYLKRGRYANAKTAFQNGLEIAKQLQYQETYFNQQISQLDQRISK